MASVGKHHLVPHHQPWLAAFTPLREPACADPVDSSITLPALDVLVPSGLGALTWQSLGHLEGPGGPGRCPERGFANHGVSTNSHRIPGVRGIARHSPGLSSPAVTETTHCETPRHQKGGEVT
ncbi:unnamed protein product [Rangifer tarandus platyrhynchus]|uniref:Uncharacterized protein n=1 Tax=Rangifer tarandus platyrhynchus TaxID=3082113 RepID=A0AC59YGG1_RANTA